MALSDGKHSFSATDYVIFSLTLLISMLIGVFFAYRAKKRGATTKRQIHGNKKMPIFPMAMSLFTSVTSGIALLSFPAEIYARGTAFTWSTVGMVIAMILSAVFIIPVIYEIKSISVYKYLEIRFKSRFIRVLGSVIFTFSILMYMAVVLYAPAIALSGVTEIPTWVLIFSIGVVCTFYTSIGGLKAVVWTDTFQAIVMYGGSLALIVMGTNAVGSISEVWNLNREWHRLDGFTNIDPNPLQYMTVWTAMFGGIFYWMGSVGASQLILQRYCSMRSVKKARGMVMVTIPFQFLIAIMCFYTGMIIFAYYQKLGCDPVKSKQIQTKDQLVIYFMIQIFKSIPGLPGLFLACLFSGTLSTVSSGINSLSAVSLKDFIQPIIEKSTGQKMKDKQATILTIIIGVFYGICAMALAFSAEPLGGIFNAVVSALGALAGPLLGLMLLGILVPWANWLGAVAGTFSGIAIALWVFFGAVITKPPKPSLPTTVLNCTNFITNSTETTTSTSLANTTTTTFTPGMQPVSDFESALMQWYALSYFMYPLISALTVLILGSIVSALTGGSDILNRDPNMVYWTHKNDRCSKHNDSESETDDYEAKQIMSSQGQELDLPEATMVMQQPDYYDAYTNGYGSPKDYYVDHTRRVRISSLV